jgi:hypothetical protein
VSDRRARYGLYGLEVQTRLALPCPLAHQRPSPRVRLVAAPARRFVLARREGAPANHARSWFHSSQLFGGEMYLRWSGLFEFLISADGRTVLYHRLGHAGRESFNTYLLSQVLSFSLLAFGVEPLHGTVVVVGGEAVVFLGDCGYGKSTMGAAFLARGYPLLTDDLVVVARGDDGFIVHAGIPRLKLFPTVSQAVLGGIAGTPMNPGTGKLVLSLAGARARRRAAPLRAIYLLSDPAVSARRTRISALSRSAAMVELVRNTFNTIVTQRHRLANQFRFASELAASVPVKRLAYPRELSALPDTCEAILADLGRQSSQRNGSRNSGSRGSER